MNIKLDQNQQIEFYNQKYNLEPFNHFFTSSTTIEVSLQEVDLLRSILDDFYFTKDEKHLSLRMLNIPSGNGRLNSMFSEYFEVINCLDPCEKAIEMLSK